MVTRSVAMFKGDSVMDKCLTHGHLFGPKFHGYYGQRNMPVPSKGSAVQDIKAVIAAKEKRVAEVKRDHFSPGGLRGGVYHEPQWTDAGAKDLHELLRREIKDLQRQLSAAL